MLIFEVIMLRKHDGIRQIIEKFLANCQHVFIPKWCKRTRKAKDFVLDKHLYKTRCDVPMEAPQRDSRPPEPDRWGSGAARTLGAPGSRRRCRNWRSLPVT